MLHLIQSLPKQARDWIAAGNIHKNTKALQVSLHEAFIEHPHETGETYLQHLLFTTKMSGRFLYIAFAIMVHGIVPFLFTRTASQQIELIYGIIKARGAHHTHEENKTHH